MSTTIAKFKTTRKVRSLASAVKEWLVGSVPAGFDIGESNADWLREWIEAFIASDAMGAKLLAETWSKATDTDKAALFAGWEHLRGPNRLQRAEKRVERYNERAAAKYPLFAAVGALDEIVAPKTVEGALKEIETFEERSRTYRDAASSKPAWDRIKEKMWSARSERTYGDDRFSLDEILVWRHTLNYHTGEPHIEEAWAEVSTICGGDAAAILLFIDRMFPVLDNMPAFKKPGGRFDEIFMAGYRAITSLRARCLEEATEK